ncbi:MAG: TrmB family transcriptional regulator [Candidatus Methanosuratus sp.]|nr:TrmB family transcriptional regulator [Candidatus Methanosuratincola sp.]
MSDDGRLIGKLSQIGLTEGEARAYLSLLKSGGEMDAKAVSESSSIPYSKVYTVLEKLASKSLIVVRRGRPTVYSVKMPSEGLSEYKRIMVRDLDSKFGDLEDALRDIRTRAEAERQDIWIIKSTEDITKKAYSTIWNARDEADVALPSIPTWTAEELYPIFLRLKAGKIRARLLFSSDAPKEKVEAISRVTNVRMRDKMFGGGIIADGNEAILFIASEGSNPSVAIWSNHVGLVQIAKTYFENLWASSTPISG